MVDIGTEGRPENVALVESALHRDDAITLTSPSCSSVRTGSDFLVVVEMENAKCLLCVLAIQSVRLDDGRILDD